MIQNITAIIPLELSLPKSLVWFIRIILTFMQQIELRTKEISNKFIKQN